MLSGGYWGWLGIGTGGPTSSPHLKFGTDLIPVIGSDRHPSLARPDPSPRSQSHHGLSDETHYRTGSLRLRRKQSLWTADQSLNLNVRDGRGHDSV